MNLDYWHKQEPSKPLFPDILWSRPETKAGAGKLAIIGGHGHAFGAPGIAWNAANHAGVGVARVLLPQAVKKTVKYVLPDADFAPSNPSGSFSKQALDDFLQISAWADGVVLAGDFGRSSETAVLLENYVKKYTGLLTVTQDAYDYFKESPEIILNRPDTAVFVSLSQLQRTFINSRNITPITYSMSTLQLIEALHDFSNKSELVIVTKHNDLFLIAYKGDVVTHPNTEKTWRVKMASRASVYWLQNSESALEAITSSLIENEAEV